MEQIKKLLKAREEQLMNLKKDKEKALKSAPSGHLRICRHGDKAYYYQRNNPKDCNGIYIREEDRHIAKRLAQKDYDQKIIGAVEQELIAIKKYLSHYPLDNAEQIYENLHKERQKLIKPICESNEQFVTNWENIEYQGKGFREEMPQLFTMKGERVRSKSEVIIADLLNREGIPYHYEYPIRLNGIGKVYPDFTVLNVKLRKEMYWEHLGMLDDPEYMEKAMQKIESYEQNGIFPGEKLILTYETKKNPINQKSIMRMIHRYL